MPWLMTEERGELRLKEATKSPQKLREPRPESSMKEEKAVFARTLGGVELARRCVSEMGWRREEGSGPNVVVLVTILFPALLFF